jgi:hypothetical protein
MSAYVAGPDQFQCLPKAIATGGSPGRRISRHMDRLASSNAEPILPRRPETRLVQDYTSRAARTGDTPFSQTVFFRIGSKRMKRILRISSREKNNPANL